MVWFKPKKADLLRWKIKASKAETAREWGDWYLNKWSKDYPDLYNESWDKTKGPMRYSTAFRRRPVRPLGRRPRRRLMVTGRSKRRSRHYARVKAKNPRYYGALGEPVGTHTGKRCLADVTATPAGYKFNSNAIYSLASIKIDQGTGINQRQRRIVNLRGIEYKFHFHLRDATLAPQYDVYLHVAAVHNKKGATAPSQDFFRSYGTERAVDFTAPSTLRPLQLMMDPINSDAYHVYFHKHWKVTEQKNLVANGGKGPEILFKKYLPIKRQIRFESDTGNSVGDDQVYFVFWCTTIASNGSTSQFTDAFTYRYEIVNHFRDPDV